MQKIPNNEYMRKITRRRFLQKTLKYGAGACALSFLYKTLKDQDISFELEQLTFPEAMFYKKLKNNAVLCQLCPRKCEIPDKRSGYCLARKNINGKLHAVTYGHFFYYHHNKNTPYDVSDFSLGAAGCNFRCPFCIAHYTALNPPEQFYRQKRNNYAHIITSASETVKSYFINPTDLIKMAKEKNYKKIKHSGNEPFTYYEYLYDFCSLSKQNNIENIVLSNAYLEKEPLKDIIKNIDSFMFSIKSFSKENHQKWVKADLDIVLKNIKEVTKQGIHADIAFLLIPGKTDSTEEITALCKWFKTNMPSNSSLLFQNFNPSHEWENLDATYPHKAKQALQIAHTLGINALYT